VEEPEGSLRPSNAIEPQLSKLGIAGRAVCLLVFLLPVWGASQTPSGASDPSPSSSDLAEASLEDLMNMKVYSASRYNQSVSEAPALVTIVTRDEIQRYGYRTLAAILRSVPGFYVPYDRLYSYAGVRGFANPGDYNTRVLLMVDGHRLNDSIFEQAMIGPEFPVDVDMIERVEVIRGPASSLYGTNAIFGVINVITRKAGDISGVELSADAASFNTYRGRASYGGHVMGIDAVLSATFLDSKGHNQLFFPEFDTAQDNYGIASHGDGEHYTDLLATLSARGLRFQAVYGSREKHDPTGAWDVAFNDPRNRVTDTHGYLDLRYERSLGSWQWMARSYYDRYGEDAYYITFVPGDSSIINRDFARGEQWGAEAQVSKSIHNRHKLTGGIEYRDQFRQEIVNYDVSPEQIYLQANIPYQVVAGYLQGEFRITDKLSLTAGVREDYVQKVGVSTNPRAALTFNPWKKTAFKLIYGTAFRSSNTYEQYYSAPGQNDTTVKLGSEKIHAWEAAWQQELGPNTALSASVFHNQLRDFIEFTSDASGSMNFCNIPDATATGGELELRGRWSNGVSGHASYSYQYAQGGATGQWLVGSPKHLGKLNLSVPLHHQNFFAGLEALYSSRRLTVTGDSVSGYAVVNLTLLARKLARHLDFSASVYNLFNQSYYDPGAQQHRQDGLEQDGRNFQVKLVWRSGSD
jgi:outer membrane cobalamin receptor